MLPPILRLLRPGDWAKNVFVLVPVVFWLAGGSDGPEAAPVLLARALAAAAAFSMAGSGFYCINDALDAAEDRMHPVKRRRPVASGEVSARTAAALGIALVAAAVAVGYVVRPPVAGVLVAYVLFQVAYNARLKRVRLVDVTTVATGFVLRAIAGALAIGTSVSIWLVVVVFAFTLFLGFVKRLGDLRAAELARSRGEGAGWTPRAGYDSVEDLNWLLAVTGSVAMVAYLAYALSDHARALFGARAIGFALLAPLLFVVVHRLYLRANQGNADSPVSAVLADRGARLAAALFSVGVVLDLYWRPVEDAIRSIFT